MKICSVKSPAHLFPSAVKITRKLTSNQMFLEDTGLPFGFWFLLGLLAYVIIVLFCMWIRFCALNSTLCPTSPCCVHCTYHWTLCKYHMFDCVDGMVDSFIGVCPKCQQEQSACSVFCCRRRHNFVDSGVNFEFFTPNCKEINCCCCRLMLGRNEQDCPMEEIEMNRLYVQHI